MIRVLLADDQALVRGAFAVKSRLGLHTGAELLTERHAQRLRDLFAHDEAAGGLLLRRSSGLATEQHCSPFVLRAEYGEVSSVGGRFGRADLGA